MSYEVSDNLLARRPSCARYSWDESAKFAKPAQSNLIGELSIHLAHGTEFFTAIVAVLRQIFPFLFMMLDFFQFIRRFLETVNASELQLR